MKKLKNISNRKTFLIGGILILILSIISYEISNIDNISAFPVLEKANIEDTNNTLSDAELLTDFLQKEACNKNSKLPEIRAKRLMAVVKNRMNDEKYPETIYDVLNQDNQFSYNTQSDYKPNNSNLLNLAQEFLDNGSNYLNNLGLNSKTEYFVSVKINENISDINNLFNILSVCNENKIQNVSLIELDYLSKCAIIYYDSEKTSEPPKIDIIYN